LKYIEIVASSDVVDTVAAIADSEEALDFRPGVPSEDGVLQMRMLISDDKLQSVLDALQKVLTSHSTARIVVLPVETSLPKAAEEERKQEDAAVAAREELYDRVEKNSRLDLIFLLLVALSTVVAAIGLIEDNVAVVIGAMVIAPLLGPNLALSLGTALGDVKLMRTAIVTNVVGLSLTIVLSVGVGILWAPESYSVELLTRTHAGLDSVALALASGAAAALSLTTGLSSVLVGVMVAVALLPPAAAFGIMLGHQNYDLAINAGLLLVINIVCVNLASKLVFLIRGIHPRTWLEKEKARRAMAVYLVGWFLTLVLLVFVVYARAA
jgi:uncharacterized hydrophobic protein (TIGR00341 family)